MIKHVVFFRLLDEAEGHTKIENATIIREGLLSLKDKISVLRSEQVGINIPNATKTDYDICLECTFDRWEDVDTYQNHPEHLKVAAYIGKCRSARAAVDYEF
ncbi:MAG: Dabb family protein [Paludibacteraceae bacterium]|nr:Dabb family protein [Candidatus Colicola coprequi]MCQ2333057.1 Dabb family protein [Paludibacteraceae bacterium]